MAKQFQSSVPVGELTARQFLMLVSNAFTKLKWEHTIADDQTAIATRATLGSPDEEITVTINDGVAGIISKSAKWVLTDLGRNKKNVDNLVAQIDQLRSQYTPEQLGEQLNEQEAQSAAEAAAFKERYEKGALTATDKLSLGVGGHYVTYTLIAVNLLVFIAMIANGVAFMEPTGLDILKWGGNMRAYTTGGEWWRLITCVFVHIGFIHLLLNMYALYMVGIYLEPIMGRWKFLAAYLSAGVLASVTSMWWSADRVSAGASGAIFGLYGLFLALLTTNYLDKNARKALLQSIGIFVVYNLVYGMKGGIDNAAHIGGLVSGFVLGYIFYFLQKKEGQAKLFPAIALVIAIVVSIPVLNKYNDDSVKFEKAWEKFAVLEEKGMRPLQQRDSITATEFISRAESESMPAWNEIKKLLNETDAYKLPASAAKQRSLLQQYTDLRLQHTKLWIEWEKAPDDNSLAEMNKITEKIEAVLEQLKQANSQ